MMTMVLFNDAYDDDDDDDDVANDHGDVVG